MKNGILHVPSVPGEYKAVVTPDTKLNPPDNEEGRTGRPF